ncbi:HD-like signal output (HDOD) protein [Herbaspirillum sp. Sphag1AN]|uniref:HDOD domain-containing protein n=1 Tax=unclassified Herbaspirillum TaxID=2624150 RepID=UPI0016141EFB|nr:MULTISPECIES: HDOD domain-containing protein [unclassified Herbaspirillum]MBB3214259.1 HD-like signal output (HDOD) protein [Herbaspirillum sp. Sphag1AN]MBB3247311.1 HD-like signal output (HDOD) protein [Herbaspirillum sp. Sphag64]
MVDLIDFEKIQQARGLPSPTGLALNIMRMCRNDNVSLSDLARQIQTDPVLAGRLIKLANAGRAPSLRPIVAVTSEALLLVGLQSIRQVALSLSLIHSYNGGTCSGFDYNGFWSRSLTTACLAQALGKRVTIAPVAELFTCGLLAGIGQLGLAVIRPQPYSELLEQHRTSTRQELRQAERARFGCDQLDLSVMMLRDWQIPSLFVDAVRFHAEPDSSGNDEQGRQQRLARLLHLAVISVDVICADTIDEDTVPLPLLEQAALLDLSPELMLEVLQDAAQERADWITIQRPSGRISA